MLAIKRKERCLFLKNEIKHRGIEVLEENENFFMIRLKGDAKFSHGERTDVFPKKAGWEVRYV